jgi:hypothetical protein
MEKKENFIRLQDFQASNGFLRFKKREERKFVFDKEKIVLGQ